MMIVGLASWLARSATRLRYEIVCELHSRARARLSSARLVGCHLLACSVKLVMEPETSQHGGDEVVGDGWYGVGDGVCIVCTIVHK